MEQEGDDDNEAWCPNVVILFAFSLGCVNCAFGVILFLFQISCRASGDCQWQQR